MDTASKLNNTTHFLSFSRKLFLSVISLFLVFAGCFLAYQYQREKEYKIDLLDIQLQDYNERLHQELARIPDSLWNTTLERYLQKYIKQDLRITVVNVQGDVLYEYKKHWQKEKDMMYAVPPKQRECPTSIPPHSMRATSYVPPSPMT